MPHIESVALTVVISVTCSLLTWAVSAGRYLQRIETMEREVGDLRDTSRTVTVIATKLDAIFDRLERLEHAIAQAWEIRA